MRDRAEADEPIGRASGTEMQRSPPRSGSRETTGESETDTELSKTDSEVRYRRLFEAAQDGILILDAGTGAIVDVNPFLMKLLGYSREEFVRKKLWEVGAFRDVEASKAAFKALKQDEFIRYEDLPLRASDGRIIQVEFISNVYWAGDQQVIQCNIRDITERKHLQDNLVKSEALLREQSVRDHLTGLFNRRYLDETLDRELERAARRCLSVGLLYIDVDNFGYYNNMRGHAAGDAILRALGNLLTGNVRGEDLASRVGGDEFVVVLPGTSPDVARLRAQGLGRSAREFRIPFRGRTLSGATLSIGVAIYPQDGLNRPDLMHSADNALYEAKRRGRSRVVVANRKYLRPEVVPGTHG